MYGFDSYDGATPYGELIEANNGQLVGTTSAGGYFGQSGTVYQVTTGGKLTILHSFCQEPYCPDGDRPYTGVVQAPNGAIYGTTYERGLGFYGTAFEFVPPNTFSIVYTFCVQIGCADGANSAGRLVVGTDGNLYGTTATGGDYNGGTIFRITPDGTQAGVFPGKSNGTFVCR
ncbi:MAG: hypothetical protein H0X25_04315 [Acidobacteriales bacterium]|nr:hypothetical protein [Terriglobales bacterium]